MAMSDLSSYFNAPPPPRKPTLREVLGREIPPIEICDVGAMEEGAERYAELIAQGLATVIAFEPDPKQFQKLKAAALPGRRYFPLFLGAGGDATFRAAHYP